MLIFRERCVYIQGDVCLYSGGGVFIFRGRCAYIRGEVCLYSGGGVFIFRGRCAYIRGEVCLYSGGLISGLISLLENRRAYIRGLITGGLLT